MKVLVTGAAGFIGSYIVGSLLDRGYEVIGADDLSGGSLDNLIAAMAHSYFKFCQVDLRDKLLVNEIFAIFRPKVIYHLAANAREGASFFQPISVTERNTLAYINTLTSAIKYGLQHMVLFSSMAVYGDQPAPFVETSPRMPVDIYGLCKANMEQVTEALAGSHGFTYTIIRPHNVFGPRQALNDIHRNVIGIWMNKIMRGEPITIYGDGQQRRAWSYIENSLPCYLKAMTCEPNQIFNIGGDSHWSINNLAEEVIKAMGCNPATYHIEHLPGRHGEVQKAYCRHDKAKKQLGLSDDYAVVTGIQAMAEWAIKQGPQEWRQSDPLEIPNSLTPRMWV